MELGWGWTEKWEIKKACEQGLRSLAIVSKFERGEKSPPFCDLSPRDTVYRECRREREREGEIRKRADYGVDSCWFSSSQLYFFLRSCCLLALKPYWRLLLLVSQEYPSKLLFSWSHLQISVLWNHEHPNLPNVKTVMTNGVINNNAHMHSTLCTFINCLVLLTSTRKYWSNLLKQPSNN